MQRIRLITILVWMVFTAPSHGAWLEWEYNTDSVDGYRVHVGTNSRSYTFNSDVGKTNRWLIPRLAIPLGRTNFFAVTAYNSAGANSKLSAEVFTNWTSTAVSPITSVTLPVPAGKYRIERATSTTAWLASSTVTGPTNIVFPITGTMGFYRYRPYFVSAVNPKSGKLAPKTRSAERGARNTPAAAAPARIAPGSVNLDPSKR